MIPPLLDQINQLNTLLKNKKSLDIDEKDKIFFSVKKIIEDAHKLDSSDSELGQALKNAFILLSKNLSQYDGDAAWFAQEINEVVKKNFNLNKLE